MITEFVKIDGIKLWEKGFFSINLDSGLRTSQVVGAYAPQFDYAINNKQAYLTGKTVEPISFPLMFTTQTGTWLESEKAEFLSIIDPDRDGFIELSFEDGLDKVYFVTLEGAIRFVSNDGFTGYYEFSVISNYPYSFSSLKTLTYNVTGSKTFSIFNSGDLSCFPELNITKLTATGPVSFMVKNSKIPVAETTFGLVQVYNAEEVYVDNSVGEIVSSLNGVYRYKDWNNKKLELVKGQNEITINGDSLVTIKYRFKYRR